MPNPSDHNAEELLKAYANKRKEEAGSPELHPVNRKLLQDEVTRTYHDACGVQPTRSAWATIRYWLPFAATVSVFVGVVTLVVVNQDVPRIRTDMPVVTDGGATKPTPKPKDDGTAKSTAEVVGPTEQFKVRDGSAPGTRKEETGLAQSALSVPTLTTKTVTPPAESTAVPSATAPFRTTANDVQPAPVQPQLPTADQVDPARGARGGGRGAGGTAFGGGGVPPGGARAFGGGGGGGFGGTNNQPFAPGVGGARGGRGAGGGRTGVPGGAGGGGAARGGGGGGRGGGFGAGTRDGTLAATPAIPAATNGVESVTRQSNTTTGTLAFATPPAVQPRVSVGGGQGNSFNVASAQNQPQTGIARASFGAEVPPGDVRQRFQREATSTVAANAAGNLLKSFDFAKMGQNIQIVDADGSIYAGAVVAPAPRIGSPRSLASEPAPRTNPTNLLFRVTGTNKTMQLSVAFDGDLTPATNSPNASIQGQAVLGGNTRLRINAVAVPTAR